MIKSEVFSKLDISFLKGRVVNVEPITYDEDAGYIWEQDTDFQLENGIIIHLSDNDVGCTKEDIGKEKSILIAAGCYRGPVEKCCGSNPEIGISDNSDFSSRVCGIIRKIVEPSEEKDKQFRRYAALDIGIGQILLVLFKDHREDFSVFHEGDCIQTDVTLEIINPEARFIFVQ
jgi:hypothetical protein